MNSNAAIFTKAGQLPGLSSHPSAGSAPWRPHHREPNVHDADGATHGGGGTTWTNDAPRTGIRAPVSGPAWYQTQRRPLYLASLFAAQNLLLLVILDGNGSVAGLVPLQGPSHVRRSVRRSHTLRTDHTGTHSSSREMYTVPENS